tara:strand:- start:25874 stop:28807 length:2934 start_codon:yes stop_codon:yes gene_type:complete
MKQILFLLLSLFSFGLQAQQVQGTVTDENNSPLISVTVTVEGTSYGVVTDFDGNYTINANTGDVLVFSYLGFISQKISVNSTTIDVRMVEDANALDEVMVVAFGTSKKRAITGALESIKTEEIIKQPQANLSNSLQGLAPGLQVLEGSGQPGESAGFLIRGIGSLSAGSGPLIVVDGAIFTGGLSQLNPNDIESVNILKDASSASIYGSKAANGVVLITTRMGKSGVTTYNINSEYGVTENTNPNNFRVMNTSEYVSYYREAMQNAGIDPDDSSSGFYLPLNQNYNTNWVDEAFQTGYFQKHDFSASGGTEKTAFFSSLGYTDQKGSIIGTGFERITGMLNLNHKASDKFDIGTKVQLSYRKADDLIATGGRSGQLSGAFNTAPTEPIFADDDTNPALIGAGYNFDIPSNAQHNPIASAILNSNVSDTWTMNSNVNLGYQLTPEIRAEALANYYYFSTIQKASINKFYLAETEGGNSEETRSNGNNFNFVGTLNYNKTFNEIHEFGLKLGYETTRERSNLLSVAASDFIFSNLNDVGLAIGEFSPNDIVTGSDGLSTNGYFARLNYAYKNKLFVEGSVRNDGASNFGPNSRRGTFGAVGLSYVLSDDFFEDSDFVNNLKVRASYGSSGNNNIGNFLWRDLYRLGVDYAAGASNFNGGIAINSAANPNLKWEKNLQLDLGVDFSLMQNKLNGSLDYFRRNSLDLLFNQPLSLTSGFDEQTVNSGAELLNTGFEISLNAYLFRNESFSWNLGANASFYNQKIVSIPDEVLFSTNIWQEGGRSDSWYLQRYDGVDPATGDALYLDANGVSSTNYNGNEDRVVVGQRTPDSYGSITNTLKYNNFTFSFMFYFSQGADAYFSLGDELNTDGANYSANQWSAALNRWQQPGDITNVPRAQINNPNGGLTSTRFLYDASYFRLQNVNLSYALPKQFVNSIGMSNISLSLTGQNLWIQTDYPGYDPTSDAYPVPRTFTFGAKLTF